MLVLIISPIVLNGNGEGIKQTHNSEYPFVLGEKLYYRMNYSIFTVGKAEIHVNPIKYYIYDRVCYKIDVYGRTAGAGAIVSRVNDHWGSLIDTTDLLPVKSWRYIEEGKFRKKEFVDFNHDEKKINVRVINNKTGRLNEPLIYDFNEASMLDMISGYAFLRTINFKQYQTGDTIKLNGFFEDKIYKFNILYMGTEFVDTKLGKIETFKLIPVMPDNKLFAGENSITAWFAADESRIPVRIEANMFIGRAGCEITGYEGTKMDPNFID
ncbi:MAG: DUF3108 domain-containing protein [Cyclobacteriaceae bacterium]|nr:DUF3108 domain-containing protein [Cyclobacteriaceae bacterium]